MLFFQEMYIQQGRCPNLVHRPRNSKNTLNGIKIKLTYKNDKVTAEVIDEE